MLVLDASKAFDRIEYVRLFELLRDRNMCPIVLRLIFTMYISQKMQVRWGEKVSSQFSVSNGVKQGGVMSPVLFTVFLDNLLKILKQRNIGCKIGVTLCPSISCLKEMLKICEDYASDYNTIFNAKKSKLMHFGRNKMNIKKTIFMAKCCTIDYVEQCVHLGTIIHSDITRKNVDSAVNDIFVRTNNLIADFSYTHSNTLFVLFKSYCMNVYGSQLWSYNNFRAVERFYTAWRKTIRRIWRIDKRTHNLLIHAIINCLPIRLLLEKRCIKCIWNLFKSLYAVGPT